MPPQISRIDIFPCKSLDGLTVERATIATGGSLEFDRRWAVVDGQGKFVNAKRYPQIQTIRARFDLPAGTIELKAPGMTIGQWPMAASGLTDWLSDYFEFAVQIVENTSIGFPDDTDSPGPTIISTETLTEISRWYPSISVAELRRRFRTNIEISGGPAFSEDLLFNKSPHPFKLGEIAIQGINPCQRCIVPTRDSLTGIATTDFQKTFITQRQDKLLPEVAADRFNHFYRLAVNTRIPNHEAGKVLSLGDCLQS
jgi:uncharacterized protein